MPPPGMSLAQRRHIERKLVAISSYLRRHPDASHPDLKLQFPFWSISSGLLKQARERAGLR